MKYLNLQILTLAMIFLFAACSSAPVKNNEPGKKTIVDENGPQLTQEESKEVAVMPVEESVASGLDKKFKTALKGQHEDDIIAAGSAILVHKPDDAFVLNGIAQYYIRSGYYDMARIYINRVLAKDAQDASANNALGVIALKEGKEHEAQVFFKKALARHDNFGPANANLGTLYVKYGDFDKAMPLLRNAYQADKKNQMIANNYAVSLRGLGEYDKALQIYKGLESGNNRMQVLLNEAILLSEYKKDYNAAKDILNKIRFVSTDPAILKKVNALASKMGTTK